MATAGATAAVVNMKNGVVYNDSPPISNWPSVTGGVYRPGASHSGADIGVREYVRGWRGDFNGEGATTPAQSVVSHSSPSTTSTEDLIKLIKFMSTEPTEPKFSTRCRLYITNLPTCTTEDDLKNIFAAYGELADVFVKKGKSYGFVRMATRALAEKACDDINGKLKFMGRIIRVRYSVTVSVIKVKNLNPFVTNELLRNGFKRFGEVERAVVICDERGNSTGEGIVEYQFRYQALTAVKRCSEGAYFMSKTLVPVIVELYKITDDISGYSEKCLTPKTDECLIERSVGPRFAKPGSFEEKYANRWKEHYRRFKAKFDLLKLEQKTEQAEMAAGEHLVNYYTQTEHLQQQNQDFHGQPPNAGSWNQNHENFNPYMAGQGPYFGQRVIMPVLPNGFYYFK